MARQVDDNVYENQTKQDVGPIRWMAPEQMGKHVYSKATDVYSFGVVLFEIWAREMPWKGSNNIKVAMDVSQGARLKAPSKAPAAVRQLMQDCWQKRPSKRPSMADVQQQLRDEMEDSEESSTL